MSYKITPTPTFKKQAKTLLKKYKSLQTELAILGKNLSENPIYGSALGRNCYKIRLSIKSKGKGKSGGARIITHVLVTHKEVLLLTIYDKKVKPDLEPNELTDLLKEVEP